MYKQNIQKAKTFKIFDMANEIKIVENGEVVVFSSPKIETFRQSNALPHPFGVQAKTQGQSPVTLRVNFVDGNTCKFRGG
jgi:hypothetical protein